MNQLPLPFDTPPAPVPTPRGETFDEALDGQPLRRQFNDVLAVVRDGQWRTLAEIAQAAGHPEASTSARLRDLNGWCDWRKETRREGRTWLYRFVKHPPGR